MSIFGTIRDAIFGSVAQVQEATQGGQAMPQFGSGQAGAGLGTAQANAGQVDVEQVLVRKAAEKGNPDLNWRQSIVDLMKLLDLDSSLDNRKALATELGYTGAKDGSAEMNIWLHRRVMQELERSGGVVPAALKD